MRALIEKVNPVVALGMGFAQTWQGIKLTVVSIVKLIQRVIPAKTIGGPILIAQLAGEQAKRGLLSFVLFMAILSINLGVINLFPIPILDGGHFLFLGLEAILRKAHQHQEDGDRPADRSDLHHPSDALRLL